MAKRFLCRSLKPSFHNGSNDLNTVGQSHCAPVFAGDCKALRKEPQRCDESHPQNGTRMGENSPGKIFPRALQRDPNNQLRPCYEITKTECLYIATKFNVNDAVFEYQNDEFDKRYGEQYRSGKINHTVEENADNVDNSARNWHRMWRGRGKFYNENNPDNPWWLSGFFLFLHT